MKSAWVVVLVCVVLATGAFAQGFGLSPRSMGMGTAGIGVADDGAAWFQNPAGLANLNVQCQDGKLWANDVIGFVGDSDDTLWGVNWSGWQPAKGMGFGAGYTSLAGGDEKTYGVGFGMNITKTPLSAGVSLMHISDGGSDTFGNIGLLYRFVQPGKAPIRLGLTVLDVTDQIGGPVWNLGVAWPATPDLLVAVDWNDVSDKYNSAFNAGAEYAFGTNKEWRARAGIFDTGDSHKLTLGAGYALPKNWRVDAAWADTEGHSTWSIGAGYSF